MTVATYVRFQSPVPDRLGRRIGVFGLVNMLGKRGLLSADEERFRRTTNAWYDSVYVNPMSGDPGVYDPEVNPRAVAWFVSTAEWLLEPIPGYLAILSAHNLPCERYTSSAPGRIIYEDPNQVVVIPDEPADQPTTMMWLPPIPRG